MLLDRGECFVQPPSPRSLYRHSTQKRRCSASVSIYKARQKRVIWAGDVFTRLEASPHLCRRANSNDTPGRNSDRVIRQHGVIRCNGEHPAGVNQDIYGFRWWHLRKTREK